MLKTRKYICTTLAALTLITGSAATSFATGNDIFPSATLNAQAAAKKDRGASHTIMKTTYVKITKEHDGARIRKWATTESTALGHAMLNTRFKSDYLIVWDNGEVWYHFPNIKDKDGNKWNGYVYSKLCTIVK